MSGIFRPGADPADYGEFRVPERFRLGSAASRIAETGHWTGRRNKPDGRMIETGVYQALWGLRDGEWKLVNESFVTLTCTGRRVSGTAAGRLCGNRSGGNPAASAYV